MDTTRHNITSKLSLSSYVFLIINYYIHYFGIPSFSSPLISHPVTYLYFKYLGIKTLVYLSQNYYNAWLVQLIGCFDCFLLLLPFHAAFRLFCYFWNVVMSSFSCAFFSHSLSLFYCRCVVFLFHDFFSLYTLSFCTLSSFCALSLYLGFSPNIVSKTTCPTCPQHSPVSHPKPLRHVSCSSKLK
jgi:hypothetical protein